MIYEINYKKATCDGAHRILDAIFECRESNPDNPITYKLVSDKAGYTWGVDMANTKIGHLTGLISNCCVVEGLPRLNSLVVNGTTFKAGAGANETEGQYQCAKEYVWSQRDHEVIAKNIRELEVIAGKIKDGQNSTVQWLYKKIRSEWESRGRLPAKVNRDKVYKQLISGVPISELNYAIV